MSEEEFIIFIYCCIADLYDDILKQSAEKLRKRGFPPKLSDPEIITMEIVGEFLKKDTDIDIWRYFKTHYLYLFPNLGSRSNFVKQSTHLWQIKQQILFLLSDKLGGNSDTIHIVDGFPIPICLFARARQCKRFETTASYGHCATKKQTYYGFKGMIMINFQGVIKTHLVMPSNIDEREGLREMVEHISGLLIGDKGFISQALKEELLMQNVTLETPLRKNMTDKRSPDFVKKLMSRRRVVETVIGQLTERFNIEKVWARDMLHFTNRITRKILSHTLAILANKHLNKEPLQFDGIITV